MATGWQKSFKASVRYNRAIGMQVQLKKAIQDGEVTKDTDVKEIARRYEMSQKQVKRFLNEAQS